MISERIRLVLVQISEVILTIISMEPESLPWSMCEALHLDTESG
jgi:hypothetical protein